MTRPELSFSELFQLFETRFSAEPTKSEAVVEFENRKLNKDENIRDYASALLKLARIIHPDMPLSDREEYIMHVMMSRDIDRENKLAFARSPPSDLESYLKALEHIEKASRQLAKWPKPTPPYKAQESTPAQKPAQASTRNAECKYCKRRGHWEHECRKKKWDEKMKSSEPKTQVKQEPSEIICFKCGKTGHMARECPEKKSEN